jgi:hypothetical protein
MATLTGTQVRHTYDSLLKLNDNDGLNSGLKVVTDGLGTPSPLSLSELEVVSSVAVEATGFKTPTGTSAQVLLANGTVGSLSSFLISGDSGIPNSITNGEILAIVGDTGISTSISSNTVSILNDDRGSSQNIFKNMAIFGGVTMSADSNSDTFNFSTGTGIKLLGDTGTDTLTLSPQMTTMQTALMLHDANVPTSWYYIPFNGTASSTIRSLDTNIVAPYDGYVRGISYRGAGTGSATSATTLTYRILNNGSVVYTSSAISLGIGSSTSKSAQLNLISTNATFSKLDRLEIQIQSDSTIQSASFSVILQEDN